MRAYGLPRRPEIAAPDCVDTIRFGLSPRAGGNLPSPSGDTHNTFRNPEAKARTRRGFKGRARAAAKVAIREWEGEDQ